MAAQNEKLRNAIANAFETFKKIADEKNAEIPSIKPKLKLFWSAILVRI